MPTLTQLGAAAGAVLAILALVALVVRSVRRAWAPVADFLEDWRGEPGRPGVPARPGVMARLGQLEQGVTQTPARLDRIEYRVSQMELQLHPNGGGSLHDKVTAIKEVVVDQP